MEKHHYFQPVRVLSYDEVKAEDGAILERVNEPFTGDCYLFPLEIGNELVAKHYHLLKEDYGKTWRVWNRVPTEEQRKAVPWETH